MKKSIYKIITIVMVFVLLGINATAYTASFNNNSTPRQITLPVSSGCGGNKIGLYVDEHLYDFSANHSSKYKWIQLTGTQDVISACNAVRINVTNMVIADTDFGSEMSQKTAQFYGSDMTTSTYKSIANNSTSSSELITSASYSYSTIVRNPYNQQIIVNDTYIHDLP